MTPERRRRIVENLGAVRDRIAAAAARSGRKAEQVRLIAVTKSAILEEIRVLVEAGCHDLGESRPQQLWARAESLRELPLCWHLIGHLQRNKVRPTIPLVTLIHSADSERLLVALDEAWRASLGPVAADDPHRHRLPVLVEVNVSGEQAKHGFRPAEVEAGLARWAALEHLEIRGLMCMAGLEGNLDDARREFAALRELRNRLQDEAPDSMRLEELSMGMSGDFEAAIEEGATLVRIGSALFEGGPP